MSQTIVRKNESLDDALRRFKRSVTKAGTLQEARKREHYEKPSVKRKRKKFQLLEERATRWVVFFILNDRKTLLNFVTTLDFVI